MFALAMFLLFGTARPASSTSAASGTRRSTWNEPPRRPRWPAFRTCPATSRPRPAAASRGGRKEWLHNCRRLDDHFRRINAESIQRLDVTVSQVVRDILPARSRHPIGSDHADGHRRIHPARPDGQPPLARTATTPASFWAAAEAQGTNRSAGDAYGTYYNPDPTLNSQYDSARLHVCDRRPVGAGSTNIDLYDPTFCAVDDQKGTGDHWISWDLAGWPAVSTLLHAVVGPRGDAPRLHGRRSDRPSGQPLQGSSGQVDKSAALRENSATWPGMPSGALPDCQANAYHNAW